LKTSGCFTVSQLEYQAISITATVKSGLPSSLLLCWHLGLILRTHAAASGLGYGNSLDWSRDCGLATITQDWRTDGRTDECPTRRRCRSSNTSRLHQLVS